MSAQSNPQGVPKELLEAKKLELIQEKVGRAFTATSLTDTFRSMLRRQPKRPVSGKNRSRLVSEM